MIHVPLGPVAPLPDNADIEWAVTTITDSGKVYGKYADYYDGKHPLTFATEKFRNTFGSMIQAMTDNLCPVVVTAFTDRLIVTGFDGDSKDDVTDIWFDNRLDRNSLTVHENVLKFGDSYVLVWPDATGTPVVWPQSPMNMTVEYSTEEFGKVLKAAKLWRNNDGYGRLNLYYPDHIARFITTDKLQSENGIPNRRSAWGPFSADDFGPEVPNTWGEVPVYHFANGVGVGEFGVSKLKDVIPLQDALNKSVCDMLVAMEFAAWPQRYATGLQVEIDPDTGKPTSTPFTPGVDRVWTAAGDVKFGEFRASDITQYTTVSDAIRLEISRVTGTPPHYMNIGSQMPTGEALKVSEGRMVKEIERDQTSFGDTWIDVLSMAQKQRGIEVDEDENSLRLIWKLASPHNPLLDAEVQVVKQQIGLSNRQSLRELGYSDEQIDQIMEEKQEEDATAFEQAQGQAQQMLKLGQGPTDSTSNTGLPSTAQGGQVPKQKPKPSAKMSPTQLRVSGKEMQ